MTIRATPKKFNMWGNSYRKGWWQLLAICPAAAKLAVILFVGFYRR
jgi:hypothetical protein